MAVTFFVTFSSIFSAPQFPWGSFDFAQDKFAPAVPRMWDVLSQGTEAKKELADSLTPWKE
jgi:hypothetical protein